MKISKEHLELLAENFQSIDETTKEIINLEAILTLPKGTEHFLSDIHGEYEANEILEVSPFEAIDQDGIGKLMKIAVKLGKETRPDIHLGICGEHGGEPSSVHFCHEVGLDYVSCSPFRVPIARLAAAQAAVEE